MECGLTRNCPGVIKLPSQRYIRLFVLVSQLSELVRKVITMRASPVCMINLAVT